MGDWRKYFTIIGCTHFVLPGIGEIKADSNNIPEEKLLKAYKVGCPYVSLTAEGIKKYDPDKKPISVNLIENSDGIEEVPKKKKFKYFNEKPE